MEGKILAGKILVSTEKSEEKTQSGIIIPESAQDKSFRGKVVMVGVSKKDEPMEVSVGDVVTYGQYGGQEVIVGGETYLLMAQSDVMFIN